MKKVIGIIAVLLLLVSIIGMCTNSNEHIDDDTNNNIEESNIDDIIETGSEDTDSTNQEDNNVCLHSSTVIKNSSDATCTEDGYTGDTYCKSCDTVISKGSTVKATGHNTEIRNKKEATTTSEGYTGDTYCKTCGEKVKSGEKIPKIENDVSEIVYITETGKKYHSRKSCSGLSNAKAIYESTLQNAKARGLTPCSKCH